jgi:hypothetical protein
MKCQLKASAENNSTVLKATKKSIILSKGPNKFFPIKFKFITTIKAKMISE